MPTLTPENWSAITCAGVQYLVAPDYIAGVGIGEAELLARNGGYVLPWPALVDAIWQAADVRIDGVTMQRTFKQWSMAEMSSPEVIADQAQRLQRELGGRTYRLLAGSHKDVCRHPDGRLGIYGWQRLDGTPIQPFFAKHVPAWRDYSQGLRLIRRV